VVTAATPSWPSIVAGGLAGGMVNLITGGWLVGIGVLALIVAMCRYCEERK
jgi:hypothetical protein